MGFSEILLNFTRIFIILTQISAKNKMPTQKMIKILKERGLNEFSKISPTTPMPLSMPLSDPSSLSYIYKL